MGTRAVWKGWLKIADLSCAVSLHAAGSTAERISLHIVNRKTGNRARRQFIDEVTGKPVDKDDLAKGREGSDGTFTIFDDDEIAATAPQADKVLDVTAFIPCAQIDRIRFDRPYFLYPGDDPAAREVHTLIRQELEKTKSAAFAEAVLFRRERRVLIRPHEDGLIAHTLQFDHEVRDEKAAFSKIPARKIEKELLDLAKHIIGTRKGDFDPATFDDRYEAAFTDLIRAKIEGKPLPKRKRQPKAKVMDLRDALRQSVKKAS